MIDEKTTGGSRRGNGHRGRGFGLHGLFGHGRGRSMRRGLVRFLILAALTERPMHGYQVIQELETLSRGRWRPSAGSVYPTLQQLEDEGLVISAEEDGRRVYTLTDAGRVAGEKVRTYRNRLREFGADTAEADLRRHAMQLVHVAMQVQHIGSPGAQREAQTLLAETRRGLYRILADDEDSAHAVTEETEGASA